LRKAVSAQVLAALGSLLATEVGALAVVVVWVIRRTRVVVAAGVVAFPVAGGAAAGALRTSPPLSSGGPRPDLLWDAVLPAAVVLGLSIAAGWYLRGRDADQARASRDAIAAARQRERVSLARELHDVVAHHVGVMVVQAQAAQAVAGIRPETAAQVLPTIETAGTDALAAMRRLVATLRDSGPGGDGVHRQDPPRRRAGQDRRPQPGRGGRLGLARGAGRGAVAGAGGLPRLAFRRTRLPRKAETGSLDLRPEPTRYRPANRRQRTDVSDKVPAMTHALPRPQAAARPRVRIVALDVLRGFALCGILLVNIPWQIATIRMPVGPPTGGTYPIADILELTVHDRFFPIFSFLFGASFALFLDTAATRTHRPRLILLRRLLVLGALGLAHQVLHPGEALAPYAVIGIVVLLPASWLPRWLVLPGTALALGAGILAGGGMLLIPDLFLLGLAAVRYGLINRLPGHGPHLAAAFAIAAAAGCGLGLPERCRGTADGARPYGGDERPQQSDLKISRHKRDPAARVSSPATPAVLLACPS
jgi:hypothetical protein